MIALAALAATLAGAGAAQAPSGTSAQPDSQALRSRAEALQAGFERQRLRAMPRTLSGGGQRCDAIIGRLCIWDDGPYARPPAPEPESTSLARLDFLAALDSIARGIPGDDWVFGQRVRYLAEAGRHDAAAALARRCGPPARWRCDAHLGYAHHRAGQVALAEIAFRRALRAMPPPIRAEWTDPAPLLDRDLGEWLARQPDSAAAAERVWTLADPLFLVAGNDRWTAHLARQVHALGSEDARNPHQLRWGDDLAEAVVRYGWSDAWERSWPTQSGQSFRVSGRDRGSPRRTLPPAVVLQPPAEADAVAWEMPKGHAQSAHLSPFLDSLAPMEGQIARFWRPDGVAILTAWTPPPTAATSPAAPATASPAVPTTPPPAGPAASARAPATLRAGLFVEQDGALVLDKRSHTASEETVRLSGTAPWSRHGVVSLEALAPHLRQAWRQRAVVGLLRPLPDVLSISDLALLEASAPHEDALGETASAPRDDALGETASALPAENLNGIASALRGSTRVRPAEPVGIAFEVYGLGHRAEAVGFRAWIERRRQGIVARAVRWLGFGGGEDAEVAWEESAPSRPQPVLRALQIGLPTLDPGDYDIVVEVSAGSRLPVSARRTVTVTRSAR